MTYNNQEFPGYIKTAGKITVLTALAGVFVFITAFMVDVGNKEFTRVLAQTASTSLTVLNTPPVFTVKPYEVVESSTSTPTNSGDDIVWGAIGTDANAADYFLLVCSTSATPTPGNNAPPSCDAGATQWGVSASTTSGTLATTSITTTELAPFSEMQNWFAWVCDADAVDARCNVTPEQGDYATSSSPFNVNSRPVFSPNLLNDGPVDPGGVIAWNSTSTDPDTEGGEDDVFLVICNSNSDYDTSADTCPNDFIASTTISVFSDASATYTAASIVRDNTYPAYGYVVDSHGHEALANPIQSNFIVNNVAPTVLGGEIDLNGGLDLVLTVPGGESPAASSTLDFTIHDANSCLTAASGTEMTNFFVSVYRGTTTDDIVSAGPDQCDGTGANNDPNDCYESGIGAATWNLSCTATSTCASPTQDYVDYTCTFPLWFVADPTDAGVSIPTSFSNDDWFASVTGADDDYATGTLATTSSPVDLISFSSLGLLANDIAYGGIAPGDDSGTLNATSTLTNLGNTGLDQEVIGESMCGTYTLATECPVSATSTIPESEQQYSSTSLAYNNVQNVTLSSTTVNEVELDVNKTTSTSTPNEGTTYWGIRVPASITLAGSYSGLNTFTAVVAEAVDW